MTSYLRYKQHLAVVDADDTEIESWITVRGNHIPIKKGQTKEEAVKSFISSKKKNLVDNHNRLIEATKLEKQGYFGKETPSHSKAITKSAIEMGKEEKNLEELMEFGVKEANKYDREYYARWSAGQEPHTLKTEQIEKDLNAYRQMRISKPDDNELLDKIHDLSDELKLRKNIEESKPESKYDPEFETVRKNALANGNVYGGKYTQKSKAEAYKEYKNDTSSKENMKKANEFVNGSGNTQKPTPAEEHTTTRTILTMFHKHYDDLYDGKTKHNASLVKEFDDKMAKDPEFKKQVQAFVRERGDVLSSDREVEAYMLAYNTTKNKLEPANKKLADFHEKANKLYTYHQDPSHGWVEVPLEDIKELGLNPSEFSYKDSKNAYLEEDVDRMEFEKAFEKKYGKKPEMIEKHTDEESFVRKLGRFSKDNNDTKKRWSADWKKNK